jgi:putative membrane protein
VKQRFVAGAAATLAIPAVALFGAGPALAAGSGSGSVQVTNTETVQAYLDPTGKLDVARVYEQVAMQGKGKVELRNPVEPRGLRNLDGFGGFDVQQGHMVGTYDVDGEHRVRSVSDYTKKLPLDIKVAYLLDGKPVSPGDVVGKSGRLEVRYTVRNVTGTPAEVSFDDGTGATSTATEDVVIPMVGSLTTTLPSNFTDVASGEANIAGDGRGGTKLSFTMTLFGPIGAPEASFGYSAMITDGVVPKASISALPVSPLDSPSFKGGAESYKGGADTGITLTAGATEIDANLLKLRDGAATLLGGLIQLRDGAKKLDAGLGAQIVPGSRQLADGAAELKGGTSKLRAGASDAKNGAAKLDAGAGELSSGAKELDAGAGKLKDGASQVDAGAGQLAAGLRSAGDQAPALLDGLVQVADGLDQLDAGLVSLYGGIGTLPAQAKPLHEGITQLRAGIGAKDQAGTLLNGLSAVQLGLENQALPGLQGVIDGLFSESSSAPGAYQKLSCAQLVLTDVIQGTLANGRAGSQHPCYYDPQTNPDSRVPILKGLTDTELAGLGVEMSKTVTTKVRDNIKGSLPGIVADPSQPKIPNDSTLVGGLEKLKLGLDSHAPGTYGREDAGGVQYALQRLMCGLDNSTSKGCPVDPKTKHKQPGLLQGLGALDAGVTQLVDGVVKTVQDGVGGKKDTAADGTLRGGVHSLQDGIDQIGEGGMALLDGLWQLGDGANALKDGTGQLAAGTKDLKAGSGRLAGGAGELADGAGQLSSGLGTLANGTGELDAGAGRLSDGASTLADGLGTAADGASQLADGLDEAADGAPALKDGAQQLSDEGASKLVEAGKETATDYGKKYALITAGADRAKSEGMAYGAPTEAIGFTAYSIELAGVDGEGSRNTGRAVGALAIFGLAGGLLFWRRSLG